MPNQHLAQDDPLRGKKVGGWSKWGGDRHGLLREETPTWMCQACGEEYPSTIPGFMCEFLTNEYAKICAKCQNISNTQQISGFYVLVKVVRKKTSIFD